MALLGMLGLLGVLERYPYRNSSEEKVILYSCVQ